MLGRRQTYNHTTSKFNTEFLSMKNEDIIVRKNERSWAIEIISQINQIAKENDLIIKRAGGESTISYNRGSRMFPDVILYEDEELGNILQGWELKMPDVPITDEVFVKDAQRKAKALGLSSCVIWNFTYAQMFVFNGDSGEFELAEQWENLKIKTRNDVSLYKREWEATLKDVVFSVNEFLQTNKIKHISIGDIISNSALNILINDNKVEVAQYLEAQAITNSVIDAKIQSWWNNINLEYLFDETDPYKAYAKNIILNWAYRIIFAHLIKRQQKEASRIDSIEYDTTPSEANDIFVEITDKCDFYNIFTSIDLNEIMPSGTWESLIDLSIFLKENGIRSIDQSMLQNILERCVNVTRRELNGQFTTPKTLARILASITIHNWTESCADPCCGTGTIPHEIIDLKRNKIGISKAIDTTWASDKYSLPLQIANVSMTSYDTINMANRIFQCNALDLKPGSTVEIVDPKTGNKATHTIPTFGAICSNLPFIAFENIPAEDENLINHIFESNAVNGKFDLSYFIALNLSSSLKDNGYLGIITSNAWLGTTAGNVFYNSLLERYNLLQVHVSAAGRWFLNADVVTTILLLQKKSGSGNDSLTTFWLWKKPLEAISVNHEYENIITNSSLLNRSLDEAVIKCSGYSQSQIDNLHNLNLSYNALFHDVLWLLNIRKILTPLTSLFKVFRGSRRGWDALFFPTENNSIEKDFLYPALFNAKKIDDLIASPDREAFSCSIDLETLYENYKGAYNWIKKFECQKNKVGKPLPDVLAKPKEMWYEMKPNEVAEIFTMMNPDKRIFFGRFKKPTFINQRIIGLRVLNNSTDVILCHALLNSVLMKFFIEAVGFGRGLGVLDINKDNVAKCFMLNPDLLSKESVSAIKEAFNIISNKKIVSIEEELQDNDWISFNHTILNAYGIDAHYESICNSLKSMRKARRAAKEKYEIKVKQGVNPIYYRQSPNTYSMAAEPNNNQ